VKPFVGTLRVINPVRKSRASSRKRVLRGDGRPSLRSVDSEIKRRAIEPRNILVVSPHLHVERGPRQAAYTWTHQVCLVTPGSENRANDHKGSPGTWETPPFPSQCRPETRLTNSGMIHGLASRADGDELGDATMVSPREGNGARRDGRQGVGASRSTAEPGELSRRTLGREGDAVSSTVGGKHGRDFEP